MLESESARRQPVRVRLFFSDSAQDPVGIGTPSRSHSTGQSCIGRIRTSRPAACGFGMGGRQRTDPQFKRVMGHSSIYSCRACLCSPGVVASSGPALLSRPAVLDTLALASMHSLRRTGGRRSRSHAGEPPCCRSRDWRCHLSLRLPHAPLLSPGQ
jgi:hypothetical protein